MDEDDILDRCSTVPAATLPVGWHWKHYGDGSGSLHDPDGKGVIGYDRQPYANAGWVEYQYYGVWSLFQDGFAEFIVFAENLARRADESGKDVPLILTLNGFANHCGYFHNAYLSGGVVLNNGYNCRHPEQEETEEIDGKTIGCCYRFSCPLAYQAGMDDLIKYGVVAEGTESVDEDYMIVSDEKVIRELRAAGVRGYAEKGKT